MTNTEREWRRIDSGSLEGMRQDPTNLNSSENLQRRLSRSREARAQFVSSQIDKGVAYQIRALRDRQDLSQERLSEVVGMNQNAISRLESPRYGRPTISTLKRLAAAFDVGLIVRFVPFSHLVNWVSGTPFVEKGLSTENMAVPSFGEEKQKYFAVRMDEGLADPVLVTGGTGESEARKERSVNVVVISDAQRRALACNGQPEYESKWSVPNRERFEGGLASAACGSNTR
jgi:transcriptional regulator with XRE-family HTH domain